MDIGAVVKSPTQDPDWIKKVVVTGLYALIPIAGWLNLAGWMKATYIRVKGGDTSLPEPGFGYMNLGVEVFIAYLPAFILGVVGSLVLTIPFRVIHLAAVGSLLNGLLSLAINLVIVPTLIYRHLVHNAGFSGAMDIPANMKVVTTNTGLFASFVLTIIVGELLGAIGFPLCCYGMLITMPFGMAVYANAVNAFEDESGGV